MSEEDVGMLARAYALAMGPRASRLDEHHAAFLHPGRSPLILLRDVGTVPLRALLLACLHESGDYSLRVPASVVRSELDDRVAAALEALPEPGDERLAELLLALPEASLLAVVAERLDQLRHLHLRGGEAGWPAVHEEVVRVWQPLADRVAEPLAVRLRHWVRTFARRLRDP